MADMALKASKLKQIPERNKHLAFGYLRENEKKNKTNYPELIKYLVLVYSNRQDKFDSNTTNDLLKINGDSIIYKPTPITLNSAGGVYSSALANTVSRDVHIWKFAYDQVDEAVIKQSCVIGIWQVDKKHNILGNNGCFDVTAGNDGVCTGYGLAMDGFLTNPESPATWGRGYLNEKIKAGDSIEFKVNFNELSLSFKLNGKDFGKAFNIKPGEYKAALSFYSQHPVKLTLLSYKDIYE